MAQEDVFKKLVSHCKEYGFVFPSSEIYDGLGAVYDYGQMGVELKNNIKQYWWQSMVLLHENIVGIDSAIFMSPLDDISNNGLIGVDVCDLDVLPSGVAVASKYLKLLQVQTHHLGCYSRKPFLVFRKHSRVTTAQGIHCVLIGKTHLHHKHALKAVAWPKLPDGGNAGIEQQIRTFSSGCS